MSVTVWCVVSSASGWADVGLQWWKVALECYDNDSFLAKGVRRRMRCAPQAPCSVTKALGEPGHPL